MGRWWRRWSFLNCPRVLSPPPPPPPPTCSAMMMESSIIQDDRCHHQYHPPWSFSKQDVKEVLERRKTSDESSSHMHSPDDGDDMIAIGDTEGMWSTSWYQEWLVSSDSVRGDQGHEYKLSTRELERLERVFFSPDSAPGLYDDPITRGRLRCRRSMGAERWSKYVKREKRVLKEHKSMLEEHWGKHFVRRMGESLSSAVPMSLRAKHRNTCGNIDNNNSTKFTHVGSKGPSQRREHTKREGSFRIRARPFSAGC